MQTLEEIETQLTRIRLAEEAIHKLTDDLCRIQHGLENITKIVLNMIPKVVCSVDDCYYEAELHCEYCRTILCRYHLEKQEKKAKKNWI